MKTSKKGFLSKCGQQSNCVSLKKTACTILRFWVKTVQGEVKCQPNISHLLNAWISCCHPRTCRNSWRHPASILAWRSPRCQRRSSTWRSSAAVSLSHHSRARCRCGWCGPSPSWNCRRRTPESLNVPGWHLERTRRTCLIWKWRRTVLIPDRTNFALIKIFWMKTRAF